MHRSPSHSTEFAPFGTRCPTRARETLQARVLHFGGRPGLLPVSLQSPPRFSLRTLVGDVRMTYTFKLSRRLARLRVAGLAALLLAAGACESEDALGPETAAPAGDQTPATASAVFAGGIPFGMYAQPTGTFGDRFNGGLRNIWPDYLVKELGEIKSRGGKVVLMLAGNEKYYKDASGHFSLSMWKARVDRFKGVNFSSYVTDGTVVAHYLIDEPNDPYNWNGQPIPPATLEQMAQYSKQLWPSLLTVVRVDPGYLRYDHRYLDAAWAQYVYRKGAAADYIRRNVSDAQERGLGLITGLNVLKGGVNGGRMTSAQVQEWGSTLLGSSYPCAFISWQYDANYLSGSGIGAAMDLLRGKAENRTTRSCGSSDGGYDPVSPPPPSPTAGVLPFGLAQLPLDQYSSQWTGAATEADPASLVQRLDRAGSAGMALVATLAPASTARNADGSFSLTRWKAQVDRYRTLVLGSYISGKTLYLHNLVDQPRCAECWGGKPIGWDVIEEMARYSKSIWPALPTTVRVPPTALARSGVRWSALDAGWAQYSTPRGDIRTWLAAEAASARNQGLGLVAGLNLLDGGGPGTPPMTASQIRDFGTTLAQDPGVCALVGWSYDAAYLGQTGIRDALGAVATAARSRAPGACVVA